jgi:hypothetical protein
MYGICHKPPSFSVVAFLRKTVAKAEYMHLKAFTDIQIITSPKISTVWNQDTASFLKLTQHEQNRIYLHYTVPSQYKPRI